MAGLGVPQEIIAKYLNITKPTLHKHFREELDSGMAVADMRIAESLFNQAISGNTSAAIFWAKARMGWSEKVDHQHTGAIEISWTK